jgi:hypothetical protein
VLRITIPLTEGFDDRSQEFVVFEGLNLDLEHCLVSLSKWESKWEKPFLAQQEKTGEQVLDYIRMMILGDFPEEGFSRLTEANIREINTYINAKMTATWIRESAPSRSNREIVTAELIYYWMISLGIPFECQYWHLNRLLTLIRVCNAKNAPKKKVPVADEIARRRELNEARRRQTGSSG